MISLLHLMSLHFLLDDRMPSDAQDSSGSTKHHIYRLGVDP